MLKEIGFIPNLYHYSSRNLLKAGSIFVTTTISYGWIFQICNLLASAETLHRNDYDEIRPNQETLSSVITHKRSLQQSSSFPSIYNLFLLNGNNGFAIEDSLRYDSLGSSISSLGDLNDDGISDLVIGADASPGVLGSTYVIFGQTNNWPPVYNLSLLNGSNGFTVRASTGGKDYLGCSVKVVRDVNGDGISDLVIGAKVASQNNITGAGRVYVIFGKRTSWSAQFNLSALDGTNGFIINGLAANNLLGWSVSSAGDFNQDGIGDLIIGAQNAGGASRTGAVYIIFGKATGWSALFDLSTLNGNNGFAIPGIISGGTVGNSVDTLGDFNGDGIDDVSFGAPGYYTTSLGTAYVLFGKPSGWTPTFNLNLLNGNNGFSVNGFALSDYMGNSLSGAGDINDDGVNDLLLGIIYADPLSLTQAGSVSVIFGHSGPWTSVFDLNTLNGTNGFLINGLTTNSLLGASVNKAGDVNGDGFSDIVLNAGGGAGAVYVVFGQQNAWPRQFDLTNLTGNNGFVVNNLFGGQSSCVGPAGDINNDGVSDIVIGVPASSASTVQYSGMAYVIFGKCSLSLVNQLTLTENQTVTLSAANHLNAFFKNASLLTYTVSNVQRGYFQFNSTPGRAINNFTQAELLAQKVQFVHDGTINRPSYQISVSNTICQTPGSMANITFLVGSPPVLVNYSFSISKGASVVLTNTNLDAYNPNPYGNSNATLIYQISNLRYGQFELVNSPGAAITQFMQQQITFGIVKFIHDGTDNSPDASVEVLNSFSLKSPLTAIRIAFNGNGSSTTLSIPAESVDQTGAIAGGAIGGILSLGAILGGGFWYRKKALDANTRKKYRLANYLYKILNLQNLNNFDTEHGQFYVFVMQKFDNEFSTQGGMTLSSMSDDEIKTLAKQVANSITTRIALTKTTFGYHKIKIEDIDSNISVIVQDVLKQRVGQDDTYIPMATFKSSSTNL